MKNSVPRFYLVTEMLGLRRSGYKIRAVKRQGQGNINRNKREKRCERTEKFTADKKFEQIVVSQRLAVHHFNLIIIYITAVI